jgi:hypothetical protein
MASLRGASAAEPAAFRVGERVLAERIFAD